MTEKTQDRKYDREFGKALMEKYLSGEKLERKYQHAERVSEFMFKVASRIKERNPELDIDPEFVGFLGYVHDVGFSVSPRRHEFHTLDILTKEEDIPYDIANRAAMHGQLAEQVGEKEDFEKYLPIGLEGMILTYADMTINDGDPMAIDDRAAGIIKRVRALDVKAINVKGIDEKFKTDLIYYLRKALPRFHRYERVVLALAGADSFGDF